MKTKLLVKKKVGLKKLILNKSHMLPSYLKMFPFYDRALPRICEAIRDIDGQVTLIDVGANIGDTASLVSDAVASNILCIEGDMEYISILKKNVKKIKNSTIEIEESYCGDGSTTKLTSIRKNGTAKLVPTTKNKLNNILSLDEILNKHPMFTSANILKIDTDGFEINVLNGAKKYLQSNKPILYFEFTPKLYINLNQDPLKILEFLVDLKYDNALFYDNYGRPKKIVSLKDKVSVVELINKIDEHNIYYYDILAFNINKPKYNSIMTTELLKFIDVSSTLVDVQKVKISSFQAALTQIKNENIILISNNNELKQKLSLIQVQLEKSMSWINELYNTKTWKIITIARSLKAKVMKPIKEFAKK